MSPVGVHNTSESADAAQAEANLQRDTNGSSKAASQSPEDQQNEVQHALSISGQGIDEEGKNLIGDNKGR